MNKKASSTMKKAEADLKQLRTQLGKVGADVAALIKHGRERYEAIDPEARNKAAAALGGLAALLAARTVVKKAKKRKAAKKIAKK
ncbi:hypothetical protein COV04_03020 [Candidatus Uhrbacteria bacterium CG10_big_fil_rev_8_21_14_0_10_48_11]|uniref:Uncharacterized protein n=1 Tax=Candidatus Uhrbacteria bacterium CG10_big_fil_rev_8_21_14_0_10_48_11 TaxID=1975037 RepID=A0A2M8LEL7_9BACT|nr:MAG: hypothetical protein COV04_03020 [Candidatus Uhrbacteria bacterium CG10_big_fil_rev_8_21_14_0_10_48_11]